VNSIGVEGQSRHSRSGVNQGKASEPHLDMPASPRGSHLPIGMIDLKPSFEHACAI